MPGLFDAAPLQLLDDVQGGVYYRPAWVDAATADTWFAELLAHAAWTAQRRMMYDREVDVPRLTASYRLDAHEPPHVLPLQAMRTILQRQIQAPFNAVGMNLYRNGHDSVAMHHDKFHMLVPGQPIALVSLGHTRSMRIRSQRDHRDAIDIPLAHGSLLVMSHASQHTHEHGIAKTTRPVGLRMSVVFRVRPQAAMAANSTPPSAR